MQKNFFKKFEKNYLQIEKDVIRYNYKQTRNTKQQLNNKILNSLGGQRYENKFKE
jgi:hypothetical protein